MKERHPDAELGNDVEIFYYLFPMDREVADDPDKAENPKPKQPGIGNLGVVREDQ